MDQSETPKKKKTKKVLLIIAAVLLVLALLIALIPGTALGLIWNLLNKIERVDGTESTMSESEYQEYMENQTTDPSIYDEEIDPTDVTWDTEPEIIDNGPNIINIMLVGSDTRTAGVRGRTDTMVLCTLNKDKKTLTLTSFMRDTYVQIPNADPNRLNAAYVFGGFDRLNGALERNFGVKADGFFAVEFDTFQDVIDMVGGVEIELTKKEAEYMNSNLYNGYGLLPIKPQVYVEGKNFMSGVEALGYSRIRYIDSDFGRTQRQRNVLSALFYKCKNLSVPQLYKLMEQVLPMLITDMDNATILSYAAQAAPLLSELKLETQRIPVDGSYRGVMINGMAVLMPDLEMNRKLLRETMAIEKP